MDFEVSSEIKLFCMSLWKNGTSPIMKNKYIRDDGRIIVIFQITKEEYKKSKLYLVDKTDIDYYPEKKESRDKYVQMDLAGIFCDVHVDHIRMWMELKDDPRCGCYYIGVVFECGILPYTFTIKYDT